MKLANLVNLSNLILQNAHLIWVDMIQPKIFTLAQKTTFVNQDSRMLSIIGEGGNRRASWFISHEFHQLSHLILYSGCLSKPEIL